MKCLQMVIHDLDEEMFLKITVWDGHGKIICADGKYAACKGCLKCWLKNPGYCVMADALQYVAEAIGTSNEIVIISQICYGGYSSTIKNILDRSIGMSLPFFTYRGGRTHHIRRYRRRQLLRVYFYGDCTPWEREIAQELVESNRVNFGFEKAETFFVKNASALKEVRWCTQ